MKLAHKEPGRSPPKYFQNIQPHNSQVFASSVLSRKSLPRTLYFKKQFKLLIHKVYVFNQLSFYALTSQVGKRAQHECKSAHVVEKIIDVATINSVRGTDDSGDENVTLHIKEQSAVNNVVLGIVNFDMSQQKMLPIENSKTFKKQFENGGGYIQYKFITYKSQHIKQAQLKDEKQFKSHLLVELNQSKDYEIQKLMKDKDAIIKQLEMKVTELIGESKRVMKSLSKEKEKSENAFGDVLRALRKNPNIKQDSHQADRFHLSSLQQPKHTVLHDRISEQNQNILGQKNNLFNFNIKVQTSKARQQEIERLEHVAAQNDSLKKQNQQLKEEIEKLGVENKTLQHEIGQLKVKHKKVVEGKYTELIQQSQSYKQLHSKESTPLYPEKSKKVRISGVAEVASEQILSFANDHILEEKDEQSSTPTKQKSKSQNSIAQLIETKQLDPQTVNFLQKMEEDNQMLRSRLGIKEEQCDKVMKELSHCTIQLKKRASQLQQLKGKYEELRMKAENMKYDGSGELENVEAGGKESMKVPNSLNLKLPQKQQPSSSNSKKYDKLIQQMKQSIITLQNKVQDRQLELMRSRISNQTLQKEKTLYQSKYLTILETMQENKEKFVLALNKAIQIDELKAQNIHMKVVSEDMLKKYEDEFKLRTQWQQRTEKYQSKLKDLIEQLDKLKTIEGEYDGLRKRVMIAEKGLTKFQTTYNDMKKFVLKIESSYYNVTKKSKSMKQPMTEQQLQQLLDQCITRLNQVQQQYFECMRQLFQSQKKDVDHIMEKRLQYESEKIDFIPELKEDEKLNRKQAIEEALQTDRKYRRKKVQAKLKTLLQDKTKAEQQRDKHGITIHDRIKNIQKRLRIFDEKLVESPNFNVKVIKPQQQSHNQSHNQSQSIQRLQQSEIHKSQLNELKQQKELKQLKELKQKIQKLQKQNLQLRQMMKESIVIDKRSPVIDVISPSQIIDPNPSAKRSRLQRMTSLNVDMVQSAINPPSSLRMSMVGDNIRQSVLINESLMKQHRKSILDEMTRNRQVFTKSFDEIKRQNTQLLKKKSQMQIQVQNYRFREQKLIMKHQERERQLQRMFRLSSDQLNKIKERLEVKLEHVEKECLQLGQENKELQQSLSVLVTQLRKVSSVLQQKQLQVITLSDDAQLMKDRILNYQQAQKQMIQSMQQMRQQVQMSEKNFHQLFQQRNEQFLKIQKAKNNQIEKLRAVIIEVEEKVEDQLAEQLRLKIELENYQKEIKRLEGENYSLEQRERMITEKLDNLRAHSTQEMMRLQQQNQALRKQLMSIAQQATTLQEELEKKHSQVDSLERQVQSLQPIYNEMCQMELKHEKEKDNYQQLLTTQNQKFIQLKQKYQQIVSDIRSVQDQNKSLRHRDLQFQEVRQTLNDKIFDKERLCLQIQREKHSIELQYKKLTEDLQNTKKKLTQQVLDNRQLQAKLQEMHQHLQSSKQRRNSSHHKSRQHPSHHSSSVQEHHNPIHGGNSRMRIDSIHSNLHKTDSSGNKSKLKISRKGSNVLNRSRQKIEQSNEMQISINNNVKGSLGVKRSNTMGLKVSRKESGQSVKSVPKTRQKQYKEIPSPRSPYSSKHKDSLHQIQENFQQMKATVFMNGEGNDQKRDHGELKGMKLMRSRTLQEDMQVQQVLVQQDVRYQQDDMKSQNLNEQNNQDNVFYSQEESEYVVLMQLPKRDIIQRVHQLKQQLSTVIQENQSLKYQLLNYQKLVNNFNHNQQHQQYRHQRSSSDPRIEIHDIKLQTLTQRSHHGEREYQPSAIKDLMGSIHKLGSQNNFMNTQNNFSSQNIQSNLGSQSNWGTNLITMQNPSSSNMRNSRNNLRNSRNNLRASRSQRNFISKHSQTSGHKSSRMSIIQRQMQQEIDKMNQLLAQREFTIEEMKQEAALLEQQLEHQKKNTQKLLQEVEALVRDTEKVENALQEKNHNIQELNTMINEERRTFQLRMQQLLQQNLQKDSMAQQIASKCDKLQQQTQQATIQKTKAQQKLQKYIKEYQKTKRRQKQSQRSYKQYQQQSQLQILCLKQQIDKLVKDLHEKNSEIYDLAERFVELEGRYQQVKVEMLQKGNENVGEKERLQQVVEKYQRVCKKLQQSQQSRRKSMMQRQTLENQLQQKDNLIQQIYKKSIMIQKKHQITLSTEQQCSSQLRTKNQQMQSHVIMLKQQLGLLNDQLLNYKNQNHSLSTDLLRVEKQLKDIMNSYQAQFTQLEGKKHTALQQMKKNQQIMQQKERQLEITRRQSRSLQGQLHKSRSQIFQLQRQLQTYKRKTVTEIQQLHEKYEFKNSQCQMLKTKIQRENDTTTQTITKQTQVEKKYQMQIKQIQQLIKEKEKEILLLNKKIKIKQVEATNYLQTVMQKERLLTGRINELELELKSVKSQLQQSKRQLAINQQSNSQSQQSILQSLNSQLQQYSTRVEQLEQQNYHLKRHNQKCQQAIRNLQKAYNKQQQKYKEKILQLQEDLDFYKAKRIDQLNMLLNETEED